MRKIGYALGTFVLLVAVCLVANLVLAMGGKEHHGGRPASGENYALSASYAAVALKTGTQCDSKNIVYAGRSMKGQFKGDWADYIKSASVDGTGITATVSKPVANWSNSTIDVSFSAQFAKGTEVKAIIGAPEERIKHNETRNLHSQ